MDVVCGAAIVFVLAQHLPTIMSGAPVSDLGFGFTYVSFWSGIDLLLAVVGYRAARALAPRLAAAQGFAAKMRESRRFWLRCAWRVLPSAWLWLAAGLTCTAAFNRSGAFGAWPPALPGAFASVLNIENIRIALSARTADQGVAFPYWALSLVAQFCLILPLVISLCRPRLFVLLAAAILLQLVQARTPGDPLSLVRTDPLLLGALIAIWTQHPTYRLFRPTGLEGWRIGRILVPAFLLLLLAFTGSGELHLVPYNMGVVAVLAAVLVWLASYDGGFVLPDGFLGKRVLSWVGARALPLYFGHIPVFLATREIWFRQDPTSLNAHQLRFVATALVLLVSLAELSHRLIEAPLRRIAPRRERAPADIAPAGALRPRRD